MNELYRQPKNNSKKIFEMSSSKTNHKPSHTYLSSLTRLSDVKTDSVQITSSQSKEAKSAQIQPGEQNMIGKTVHKTLKTKTMSKMKSSFENEVSYWLL